MVSSIKIEFVLIFIFLQILILKYFNYNNDYIISFIGVFVLVSFKLVPQIIYVFSLFNKIRQSQVATKVFLDEYLKIGDKISIKSENIIFAIALDEVKKFINSSARKWNSIKEEIIKPVFIKDSKPVDDNNNGVADRYIVDENNDGNNDKIYIDENEDGNIDGLITDDNNDGIWDRFVLDEDFNGEADTVALDENGDGKIDVIGKDFNEDGEIDKWENV